MDATRAASSAVPAPSIESPRTRLALELVAVGAILSLALWQRLPNLDAYTGKFDEGIRTAQLMLMSHGFRPIRDIFASQGPLSLDIFFPFWEAAGETLYGARLAVVVYSLISIVLAALSARSISGTMAGLVAALLLALSPTYLKNSRLALVEIPALVPALLALWLMLHARRQRSTVRVGLSAASLAIALMTKPMVMPVIAPCAMLLLLRRERPGRMIRDLALAALVGSVTLLLISLAFGPEQVFNQVVRYRQGSMAVEKWSLGENWRLISDELIWEQTGFYACVIVGWMALLRWRTTVAIALLAWIGASFWLLLTYVPLQIKHDTILLPPLTITAAAGLGLLVDQMRQASRRSIALGFATILTLSALAYLAGVPTIVAKNRQTVNVAGEGRADLYPDETELVQALTQPGEFIVTDDPFLAYGSNRLVPPLLVDTSYFRIRSGSLSAQDVIDAAERFDVKVLFLFTDGLRELRRVADWADDRYQVISASERRNGKDRSIYLRRDADLSAARAWLDQQLDERSRVDFGAQLRLTGYAVDRREIRPGGSLELTLAWETLATMPVDYRLITILRGPDGQIVEQSERSLSGGGLGTSRWDPGRWIFRTTTLDIRRARQPGEYSLAVGLYDSRARRQASVTSGGAGEDVTLTTLRMR